MKLGIIFLLGFFVLVPNILSIDGAVQFQLVELSNNV